MRRLGSQIDRHVEDAWDGAQGFLYSAHTRGAGHVRDVEFPVAGPDLVAGTANRIDQLRRGDRRIGAHPCLFGRKIDARLCDARHFR